MCWSGMSPWKGGVVAWRKNDTGGKGDVSKPVIEIPTNTKRLLPVYIREGSREPRSPCPQCRICHASISSAMVSHETQYNTVRASRDG